MVFKAYHYVVFLFTGLIAGFIDSIAGGGGIITMPVLLALGLPPHAALATNKLQSSFGSGMASFNFIRKGFISWKKIILGVVYTLIGAALGTSASLLVAASILEKAIPLVLVVIFLFTIFSPKFGEQDREPKLTEQLFFLVFGISLGFYDGFFGPGTGMFWTIAFVVILGLNLKKATAQTKVMNFTSNIVSLAVFLISGNVIFKVGLIMALGQLVGSYLGSNIVIHKEVKLIRAFFLIMTALTLVKLLYNNYR